MINLLNNKNKLILIVFVVIIFYVIFVLYSDINQFTHVWSKIDFRYVPLVLIIHFAFFFIRSIRQKLLLDHLKIKISLKDNMILQLAGLSLIITPGGSGEIIKSYFLNNKNKIPYSRTIPVVLVEKYNDLLSVVIIILIMLVFENSYIAEVVVTIMIILLATSYFIISSNTLFQKLIPIVTRLRIINKVSENISIFHQSLSLLLQFRIILVSTIIGIIAWFSESIAIYLGFKVFNIGYSFITSTLLMYCATVIGAVSFIPGGVGITETGMLALLIKSGLDKPTASALILFTRFTSMWFYALVGIVVARFVITRNNRHLKN